MQLNDNDLNNLTKLAKYSTKYPSLIIDVEEFKAYLLKLVFKDKDYLESLDLSKIEIDFTELYIGKLKTKVLPLCEKSNNDLALYNLLKILAMENEFNSYVNKSARWLDFQNIIPLKDYKDKIIEFNSKKELSIKSDAIDIFMDKLSRLVGKPSNFNPNILMQKVNENYKKIKLEDNNFLAHTLVSTKDLFGKSEIVSKHNVDTIYPYERQFKDNVYLRVLSPTLSDYLQSLKEPKSSSNQVNQFILKNNGKTSDLHLEKFKKLQEKFAYLNQEGYKKFPAKAVTISDVDDKFNLCPILLIDSQKTAIIISTNSAYFVSKTNNGSITPLYTLDKNRPYHTQLFKENKLNKFLDKVKIVHTTKEFELIKEVLDSTYDSRKSVKKLIAMVENFKKNGRKII